MVMYAFRDEINILFGNTGKSIHLHQYYILNFHIAFFPKVRRGILNLHLTVYWYSVYSLIKKIETCLFVLHYCTKLLDF